MQHHSVNDELAGQRPLRTDDFDYDLPTRAHRAGPRRAARLVPACSCCTASTGAVEYQDASRDIVDYLESGRLARRRTRRASCRRASWATSPARAGSRSALLHQPPRGPRCARRHAWECLVRPGKQPQARRASSSSARAACSRPWTAPVVLTGAEVGRAPWPTASGAAPRALLERRRALTSSTRPCTRRATCRCRPTSPSTRATRRSIRRSSPCATSTRPRHPPPGSTSPPSSSSACKAEGRGLGHRGARGGHRHVPHRRGGRPHPARDAHRALPRAARRWSTPMHATEGGGRARRGGGHDLGPLASRAPGTRRRRRAAPGLRASLRARRRLGRRVRTGGRRGAPRTRRRTCSSCRGATFHVVDVLVTNFHVPRSTLMMLVSAFATREQIMERLRRRRFGRSYRMLSFGDAMLIL